MNPKKIQIKLFTQSAVDLTEIIPIFHRWIQDDLLDGLLLDVADYRHVPNGPGVFLIGHEGDYALDLAKGRPGLIYKHKREWPAGVESTADKVTFALQKLKAAADLLAQHANLSFQQNEVELSFPDRLSTPNTQAAFDEIVAELAANDLITVEGVPAQPIYLSVDPRQALTLALKTATVAEAA